MPYCPVIATLGYVLNSDQTQVLMIHRNKRPEDLHFGKINGLGGKLERDEDVVSGMRREVYEEAGLTCRELRFVGTVSWPGFGVNGEDWFGFIFRIEQYDGDPNIDNDEGTLQWVPIADLMDRNLWEGDRHFLPLVFANPLRQFHGVMPYRDGRPTDWQVAYVS